MLLFKNNLIVFLVLILSGCGFSPLYDKNYKSRITNTKIYVAEIEGPIGYELKKILARNFGSHNSPTHRLEVFAKIITNQGIITKANEITRYNVSMVASFELIPITGQKGLKVQKVSSETGYSSEISVSGYATNTAKKDAQLRLARHLADQIITRLATSSEVWSK